VHWIWPLKQRCLHQLNGDPVPGSAGHQYWLPGFKSPKPVSETSVELLSFSLSARVFRRSYGRFQASCETESVCHRTAPAASHLPASNRGKAAIKFDLLAGLCQPPTRRSLLVTTAILRCLSSEKRWKVTANMSNLARRNHASGPVFTQKVTAVNTLSSGPQFHHALLLWADTVVLHAGWCAVHTHNHRTTPSRPDPLRQ